MPAFVYFGRRWRVASDDFVLPAFFCAFGRFLVVLFLLYTLFFFLECDDTWPSFSSSAPLPWYLLSVFLVTLWFFILECCILSIASKGTMITHEVRIWMSPLISARSISVVLEGFLVLLGIGLFASYTTCDHDNVIYLVRKNMNMYF